MNVPDPSEMRCGAYAATVAGLLALIGALVAVCAFTLAAEHWWGWQ